MEGPTRKYLCVFETKNRIQISDVRVKRSFKLIKLKKPEGLALQAVSLIGIGDKNWNK
jgi:hypothetical protein